MIVKPAGTGRRAGSSRPARCPFRRGYPVRPRTARRSLDVSASRRGIFSRQGGPRLQPHGTSSVDPSLRGCRSGHRRIRLNRVRARAGRTAGADRRDRRRIRPLCGGTSSALSDPPLAPLRGTASARAPVVLAVHLHQPPRTGPGAATRILPVAARRHAGAVAPAGRDLCRRRNTANMSRSGASTDSTALLREAWSRASSSPAGSAGMICWFEAGVPTRSARSSRAARRPRLLAEAPARTTTGRSSAVPCTGASSTRGCPPATPPTTASASTSSAPISSRWSATAGARGYRVEPGAETASGPGLSLRGPATPAHGFRAADSQRLQ